MADGGPRSILAVRGRWSGISQNFAGFSQNGQDFIGDCGGGGTEAAGRGDQAAGFEFCGFDGYTASGSFLTD